MEDKTIVYTTTPLPMIHKKQPVPLGTIQNFRLHKAERTSVLLMREGNFICAVLY